MRSLLSPRTRRPTGIIFTLQTRANYGAALYQDPTATLDDLHEAVTMLEETARTARRVLGSAHPLTAQFEDDLQDAQAALREATPPGRAA